MRKQRFSTAILMSGLMLAPHFACQKKAEQQEEGGQGEGNASPAQALEKMNMRIPENEEGLYCKLSDKEQLERAKELREELFSKVEAVKELEDGYALRFPPEEAMMRLLHEHVRIEWNCCPFFEFVLRYSKDRGPLWLELRGGEKVKEMIRPKAEELMKGSA